MRKTAKISAIVLTGPTATGKTALAVTLARSLNAEIISADSRQVYRGMDLGTGKDMAEYSAGGPPVPVHLIDVAEPTETYHLARFRRDAARLMQEISARGRVPLFCGGTALYLDSLLRDYRLPGQAPVSGERARLNSLTKEELAAEFRTRFPEAYERCPDKDNFNRLRRAFEIASAPAESLPPMPPAVFLVLGVYYPRDQVRERIALRLRSRLEQGMIEEVRRLHEENKIPWERLEFFGLEYREIARYLQGRCSREEMERTLLDRIRQFAKRQDIFFRKMERSGIDIFWLRGEDRAAEALTLARRFLAGEPSGPCSFRLKDVLYGRKTQ